MRYCFIINPSAGKGAKKEELKDKIELSCLEAGVSFDIIMTEAPGDAKNIVRRYSDAYPDDEIYFYACGGDGTACEVLGGVMSLSGRDDIFMGIVPSGTGNDFVKNFAPFERFFDIGAQIKARPLVVDVLRCNDVYAINMVNIGFDCEVVCNTIKFKHNKFIPSKLAYIMGLLVTLIKKPGVKVKISGEDKKFLLMTFANGSFCGGGFHSNPYADIHEGKVDALFINDVTRVKFLSLVGSYKKGTHIVEKNEDILLNEKAEGFELVFDNETNASIDGEIFKFSQLSISAIKGGLKFLLPEGVEEIKESASCEAGKVSL